MVNLTDQLVFDVDFARKQFPFFDSKQANEWAFFDNAGGTFPCNLSIFTKIIRFSLTAIMHLLLLQESRWTAVEK